MILTRLALCADEVDLTPGAIGPSVRHVLSELRFPGFPAVLLSMNVLWMLERTSLEDDQSFTAEAMLEFDGTAFESIAVPVDFGESHSVAIAIPARRISLPRPGLLSVRLLVSGSDSATWSIAVLPT